MADPQPYIDEDGEVRELDAHFFAHAKPGRPPLPSDLRKQRVTMMRDPDSLAALKADGRGWQTRAAALLRAALRL